MAGKIAQMEGKIGHNFLCTSIPSNRCFVSFEAVQSSTNGSDIIRLLLTTIMNNSAAQGRPEKSYVRGRLLHGLM